MSTNKYNYKIWLVFLLIASLFFIIILRLFYLQVIKHEFYKKKSRDQQERIIKLNPVRGDIIDRNGQLLATSVKAYSVYADPFLIRDKQKAAAAISEYLNVSNPQIWDTSRRFVWVKRKVPQEIKDKIDITGIYFLPDTKRAYPGKFNAAQLLGFVNIDDDGASGLEHYYNNILKGSPGSMIMESDPSGKFIYSYNQKIYPAKNGKKLQLTIDKNIQFMMENELQKAVETFQAKSAVAIMMDIKTGEILGMANYPYFDPNHYSEYNPQYFQNNAIAMAIEPGSVMKLFTVAAALEEKVINISQLIYIPEKLVVNGTIIEEAHKEEASSKSVTEIIEKSLNVGAAKIGLMLGRDKLYKYLSLLEFGKVSQMNIPGENSGILNPYTNWSQVDLSRISFGYSIAVTPIQLIKAASVFGNEGYMVQPYIIIDKHHHPKKSKRIFSSRTAKQMLDMMHGVVEEGTGTLTRIKGFSIGGKTGTARRFVQENNAYLPGSYNNSFLGIFPISRPAYIMLVVITDPQTNKFASMTAVPVFKNIAQQVLRYKQLPPDKRLTEDVIVITSNR
ncbi:MAG: penicillin-binding protein 2 [Candidatus Margulisbacteria bacterium]|nr:penicillin-binding protein 2 [Candidatus Margulisiibacteriota bacterium]